jgi:peptidoglycan/xylan/chitin deacetylase (PgdA/CDA1 family)
VPLATFGPGAVEIPILLYHHVSASDGGSRYTIGAEAFEEQLRFLAEHGYHTVTVREVAAAIRAGAQLPAKPVVLTFDDGNLNTYTEAWPRLQAHGFVGVVYVVANRLGSPGFLSAAQLQELASAGWEIGSHSWSHANLTTTERSQWRQEIVGSRVELQRALGPGVESFAYPFGAVTEEIIREAYEAGYTSAVGLGPSIVHDRGSLYYLQRREVWGNWDLAVFERLLPDAG